MNDSRINDSANTDIIEELQRLLGVEIGSRVQSALVKDGIATIVMGATGLGEKGREKLEELVRANAMQIAGVTQVRVAMMADRAEGPRGPRIVAVGSGKGGVGKSTLTANLAIALKQAGMKVGVVDADVYGPSQPTLLGNKDAKPEARDEKLIPVASPHDIPVLSMGHLVAPGKALAWRGPMAGNALNQLIDAHWDDVEVLLVDLPPGTGDVQLTMLQRHKPAGAIIVSTPQDLALIDAQRAANLFDGGKVPIIGLVENMSGYTCPECGHISDPFGRGGVEDAAAATDIAFLGRIPLAMAIRVDSDAGTLTAGGDGPEASAFADIARQLMEWLESKPAR